MQRVETDTQHGTRDPALDEELADVLTTISDIAKRLANRLADQSKLNKEETRYEQKE